MGETEALPVLFQCRVGTLVAGKLRFVKTDETRVDLETDAVVVPMAQRQVIDMFYGGIWPELRPRLVEIAQNCLLEKPTGRIKRSSHKQVKGFEERFNSAWTV